MKENRNAFFLSSFFGHVVLSMLHFELFVTKASKQPFNLGRISMTGCYIFFGCHLTLGIVDILENMVIRFLMGTFSRRAECELSDSQTF